ncbi:MAG: PKD domain-containing protein [Myxococcota bacterium]
MTSTQTFARWLIVLCAAVALVGCNAEERPAVEDAGPIDSSNDQLPRTVADFTWEPETITVGQPVVFDATATDPVDASLRLDYSWEFDYSLTRTGEKATHIFSRPGEHHVELLADNAGWKDTVEKTIIVEPAPALAEGSATLDVRALDLAGRPLADATVGLLDHPRSVAVDEQGWATLDGLPEGQRLSVVVRAPGISPRYQTVEIPPDVEQASIEIAASPFAGRETIRVIESNALQFGPYSFFIPRLSFVDADGNRLQGGEVDVEVSPIVHTRADRPSVPGSYQTFDQAGAHKHRFVGGLDIRVYHDGRPAALAPGRTLELTLPATYPATYEGLPVSVLSLEPTSGYWLETRTTHTQLTDRSPTQIGAEVEIGRLGPWALALPVEQVCDVRVECRDASGSPTACTIRTMSEGIDGVGSRCEPTTYTEGVRCEDDRNCVNCLEGTTRVDYISAPCYVDGQGNSICPNASGSASVARRSCPPDDDFTCVSDPSGLGHCSLGAATSCTNEELFCDVHSRLESATEPESGVCSAPQSQFVANEGIYAPARVIGGPSTLTFPTGRATIDALGPAGNQRATSAIVGTLDGCPEGPVVLDLE